MEIFRGCTRGCRFCQAGMITRPVRERSITTVGQMVRDGLEFSGFSEVGLLSLSQRRPLRDRRHVLRAGRAVRGHATSRCRCRPPGSTPSTSTLAQELSRNGRRTGLTFAPEGGSERIRRVINKMVSEEDLIRTVVTAYTQRLAAGEALLHVRPADRDRRGRAADRPAGARGDQGRPGGDRLQGHPLHGLDRRVRAQAAHPVPVGRDGSLRRSSTTGSSCSSRRSTPTARWAARSASATTTASRR